ncbi:hypothetical protein TIFTF001_048803 [Ficus carica]|uniref:Uncharacterized protein n=1 Tax=Ficus carica TaxID=3494 RepID=A0AA88CL44_FICCA|nr:hypothetical protein TIFTF001_048803 [Ficus carica]
MDSISLSESEIPVSLLMRVTIFCVFAFGQFFMKWFLLPQIKHLVDLLLLKFLLFLRNFHDPFFLEKNLFRLKPFFFLNFRVLDDGLEEQEEHEHPGVGLFGHLELVLRTHLIDGSEYELADLSKGDICNMLVSCR